MKEIVEVIMPIGFLLVGLGIAGLFIYYGLKPSGKKRPDPMEQEDIKVKGKFIGRT